MPTFSIAIKTWFFRVKEIIKLKILKYFHNSPQRKNRKWPFSRLHLSVKTNYLKQFGHLNKICLEREYCTAMFSFIGGKYVIGNICFLKEKIKYFITVIIKHIHHSYLLLLEQSLNLLRITSQRIRKKSKINLFSCVFTLFHFSSRLSW